jgi:hypothetical protein
MDQLIGFIRGMRESYETDPKRFDECIYTPFTAPATVFDFPAPSAILAAFRRSSSGNPLAQPRHDTMPPLTPGLSRSVSPMPFAEEQRTVPTGAIDVRRPSRVEDIMAEFSTPQASIPSESVAMKSLPNDGTGNFSIHSFASYS